MSLLESLIIPINTELNPTCHLVALLGAHHILHVSMIRVKALFLNILLFYFHPILRLTLTYVFGCICNENKMFIPRKRRASVWFFTKLLTFLHTSDDSLPNGPKLVT